MRAGDRRRGVALHLLLERFARHVRDADRVLGLTFGKSRFLGGALKNTDPALTT
jgi:hypothetical protein